MSWQKLKESRNTDFAKIKEKTKYQNNCRDRTEISNCRSWRKVEIQIAETEQKYKIVEAKKKKKYQNNCRDKTENIKLQKLKESRNIRFCRSRRQNITLKKIIETERKYQIAETKEKKKYQNNCRDKTEIPNCRSWREDEIPKQL